MDLNQAKTYLETQLAIEHSRVMSESICEFVGENKVRLKALVAIVDGPDLILHQRGFYALSVFGDKYPKLLLPYFKTFFKILNNPLHEGYGRFFTRYLSQIDIPKKWQGLAVDYCFSAMENPKVPIAIQAHSMTVLFNIGKQEPDILPELSDIINSRYENASAGYKSRAKRTLKAINKILSQ